MMIPFPFSDVFSAGVPTALGPSVSLMQRFESNAQCADLLARIERGADGQDPNALWGELMQHVAQQLERGISSSMTAFPVRENLEAEAKIMTPVETPLRNFLPRVPGSGTSVSWKMQTAFGAGLGTLATLDGTANAVNTFKVANARGFFVGETIAYVSTLSAVVSTHTITAINYTSNVISVSSAGIASDTQVSTATLIKTSNFWPEQGANSRMFYSETGAPEESTTVYANRSASYKLLGDMGSVTMFAMASGANFQNQYATEKRNTLLRTMLKEEYALLHGESAVIAKPWGDGTTALGYQGLRPYILANAPTAHIQTSVGALTLRHLDQQLTRVYTQGGRGLFIMMNAQEIESMSRLATNQGNYRIMITGDISNASVGVKIGKFVHAVSGEEVPIYRHPFMPAGEIIFGAQRNQEGQAVSEVDVLPQAMAPESAFVDGIQGYYAQEIAPDSSAPEVLRFKVSLYSVPKWKDQTKYAISQGVAVAA